MEFTSTLTLDRLIKGCLSGSRQCQKDLYDKYSSQLYPICLINSPNNAVAEEALIEVFVYVFDHLPYYNIETSFDTWLKNITVEIVLENNKKHRVLKAV